MAIATAVIHKIQTIESNLCQISIMMKKNKSKDSFQEMKNHNNKAINNSK